MGISQAELKELFYYNPITGVFYNYKTEGDTASPCTNGYLCTRINKKTYYLHRLAFLYMTGSFPTYDVDHINGIRSDNSWENLRPSTRSQNLQNRSANLNRDLPKNVYQIPSGKYRVGIKYEGKRKHYGYFWSLEEATQVAQKAAKDLFGEYAKSV